MEFKHNLTQEEFYASRFDDNFDDSHNEECDPLSDEDEYKLKKSLIFIRAYYHMLKDDPEKSNHMIMKLYLKLNYLNDILYRANLHELKGFQKIIPILLDLSTNECNLLHSCSLNILASSTYLFNDIIDELLEYHFYDSINFNLRIPAENFPDKRHVFRWIYNFLNTHENLAVQFFDNVSISDIFESSKDYLSIANDSYCQIMFTHIILLKNLTSEQIQTCVLFFNYCFQEQKIEGTYYILYSIHKLLSNTNLYPSEFLCSVVNDLKIDNIISQHIQNENIDREKCFSFCILADLYQLGFQNNSNLVPYLLQIITEDNLTDWFLKHLIKSIYKILSFCDQDMVSYIFYNATEILTQISTIDTYYCILMILNRAKMDELLFFISDTYMDLLCSIIFTDDDALLNLLATGFIRLIQAAEIFDKIDSLRNLFLSYNGFDIFDDVFSNTHILTPLLLDQLHQTIGKLDLL